MTIDIEGLKNANPIQEVVKEVWGYELVGQGASLTPRKGTKEGGLVVNIDKQIYFWNTQGRGGDVISLLENEKNMTFQEAVQWLAKRSGFPLHMDEIEVKRLTATRQRADTLTTLMKHYLVPALLQHEKALAYAEGRGWDADFLNEAGCGFWNGDKRALAAFCRERGIDVNNTAVQAIMGIPANYFLYGHWDRSHCQYVSGRAIEGKGHYNPRAELAGERLPLWNHALNRRMLQRIVVVEGQADALTMAKWHIPAVALAGCHASSKLIKQLEAFKDIYIALDQDEVGQNSITELAAELGPLCHIVNWPKNENPEGYEIKDANDWAVHGDGSAESCGLLFATAPVYAVWLCQMIEKVKPLLREEMLSRAISMVARMNPYSYERYSKAIVNALPNEIGKQQLNNMVKALQKDSTASRTELTAPNGHLDGCLFEMTYDADHPDGPRSGFAVRHPDGRISTTRIVETENYRILPPSPYETVLQRGFIKMCTHPEEYGSDLDLLRDIRKFIHKYVDLPEHIEMMASYYVMMTWCFDKFYVIPYLRARGDSDSGKSRFTETVGYLCMRPIMINGATTPSPVFRLMSAWNGLTVVMDEADLPHSETSSDWTMMLNTGYKKEGGILRTNMSNGDATVEAFSAYGPKLVNMRGRFPDDATESRCLTWETSSGRGVRDDIPRYMDRELFQKEALEIRNKLLKWRLRTWKDIDPDYNHERTKHLPGRLVEITVSLMSISQDEAFKQSVLDFVEKMNQKAVMDRQDTMAAKVLEAIFRAYYLPDAQAKELPEALRMKVAHIARQTNRLIDQENLEASLQDDEKSIAKNIRPGTIGKIISNSLNLETKRGSVGTKPKILVWDDVRLSALMQRYGFVELVMDLKAKAQELAEKDNEKEKGDDNNNGDVLGFNF